MGAAPSLKTTRSIDSFSRIDLKDKNLPDLLQEGQYSYNYNGLTFEYLYQPSRNPDHQKRLVVLYTGAVNREKYQLPVYQRWSWAHRFNANVLCTSDPSLRLSEDIPIAWYFGTIETNVALAYANLVADICDKENIALSDVVLYGSSGGGFSALQALRYLPEAAVIAINSQTWLKKYHEKHYRIFRETCIQNAEYPDDHVRLSLFASISDFTQSRIVLAQNKEFDAFHYEHHHLPFLGALKDEGAKRVTEVLFENEKGHSAGEPQALLPELLRLVR
ncbi:MAG: hypothetical protein LBE22_04455 [Azoarcus sp.]|jgi:pimeloyl-ACP methyl ester carboxylesterase|nr:hypothetical protein [Azoarcus sp.]